MQKSEEADVGVELIVALRLEVKKLRFSHSSLKISAKDLNLESWLSNRWNTFDNQNLLFCFHFITRIQKMNHQNHNIKVLYLFQVYILSSDSVTDSSFSIKKTATLTVKWHPIFKIYVQIMLKFQFWVY